MDAINTYVQIRNQGHVFNVNVRGIHARIRLLYSVFWGISCSDFNPNFEITPTPQALLNVVA